MPFDEPDLSEAQALGLQSNVAAALPQAFLLSAITDFSSEIDRRSTSTTFRRLMGALSQRTLVSDPRFGEVQSALEALRVLLNWTAPDSPTQRLDSLKQIEEQIALLLKKVMPTVRTVSLRVEVDEIQALFSQGVAIAIDDGVATDVLAKGHGLQRCVVFTLLQALILNDRNRLMAPAEPAEHERPIILLVEEPELYLHPQLSKLFFDVLEDFSRLDQVIYTTHSPWFVDAYEAERVAIVSKPTQTHGTVVCTCNSAAFEGLNDRRLFQGFSRMNPAMNELFFAKRVLLLEGPEDAIAVCAVLTRSGKIRTRPEELGWSLVSCGGKGCIPFFQRLLNAFSIPYAVLHDSDLTPQMEPGLAAQHLRSNKAILDLCGGNPVKAIPMSLESMFGREHFRDQFDAHTYFLDEVDIPAQLTGFVLELLGLD